MFSEDQIINAFVTLFVTIDPVGLAPIFLGLTDGMSSTERRSVSVRAVIISLCLLTLFLFAGQAILDTLGITIHAFRVAGGLLLFFIAFEMVFGTRQKRKQVTTEQAMSKDQIANLAVFPLSLPLIAGPGAISAIILLSSTNDGSWEWRGVLFAVMAAVLALVLLAFIAAEFIDKYLGETGRMILTRLLGVLLAALAVQFVVDGLKSLLL